MSLLDLERVETPDDTSDSGLVHSFCTCRRDTALCGADIRNEKTLPAGSYPNDCFVCEEMCYCPSCGARILR